MTLHVLLHVSFEGPGHIAHWAKQHGCSIERVCLYDGDPLPEVDAVDGLIVMGGPMGAQDDTRHPWLPRERQLIQTVVEAERPVLGVCLGAQLIACALGGSIRASPEREIGWLPLQWTHGARRHPRIRPLTRTLPDPVVFHWHGDTFSLPDGATRLAATEACGNQAFAIGDHVVGVQFHPEATPESVRAMIDAGRSDVEAGGAFVQSAATMRGVPANTYRTGHRILEPILDDLFG